MSSMMDLLTARPVPSLRSVCLRVALKLGREPQPAANVVASLGDEAEALGLNPVAAMREAEAVCRAHGVDPLQVEPCSMLRWLALWLMVDTLGEPGRIDDGTKRRLREIAA